MGMIRLSWMQLNFSVFWKNQNIKHWFHFSFLFF
jgi:hypothetical protein